MSQIKIKKPSKDLLISSEMLHNLFTYDQSTGFLIHKVRTEGHNVRDWNSKYAGKSAGTKQNKGYISITIKTSKGRKSYLAHRVIFMLLYGTIPDEVDHINRDRSDNRIENLRGATHSQNQAHRTQVTISKSGYRGVWFDKGTGKWRAGISVDGKGKTIGRYATKELAAMAYNASAVLHHGEFATLNEVAHTPQP